VTVGSPANASRRSGIKAGRKGSAGEIKIEVFSEGGKGFLVANFDTKSAEDA